MTVTSSIPHDSFVTPSLVSPKKRRLNDPGLLFKTDCGTSITMEYRTLPNVPSMYVRVHFIPSDVVPDASKLVVPKNPKSTRRFFT